MVGLTNDLFDQIGNGNENAEHKAQTGPKKSTFQVSQVRVVLGMVNLVSNHLNQGVVQTFVCTVNHRTQNLLCQPNTDACDGSAEEDENARADRVHLSGLVVCWMCIQIK